MHRSLLAPSLALALPVLFAAACSSTSSKSQSLQRVDDLLTHVERVQVESVVAKEKSRAALLELEALVSPTFQGDPAAAYGKLLTAIKHNEEQERKLASAITPMHSTAEQVFQQWTSDLEAFGNSRMRQRSHVRLEETRGRFQAILTCAKSAQVTYETFNADLRDHALFIGHDFNTTAVETIAGDVLALREQITDLEQRLDATAAAARAYVESSALHGKIEFSTDEAPPLPEQGQATKPGETAPQGNTPAKRSTLKRRPAATTGDATDTTTMPTPTPQGGGSL